MAKAAGNGHPFGYVVTTKEVAEALSMDGCFFSSAGGCPVSCVVGSTVIDTVLSEGLQENARNVGRYLRAKLLDLAAKHPSVMGYVHGHGLYQGIEIIKQGGEPGTMEAKAICERMLELGVLCHSTGDYSNIMKVKPPLCFTERDSDFFVAALDVALSERYYKNSERTKL
jgi:4-aminobutyrate aminotransferase-like enzyme